MGSYCSLKVNDFELMWNQNNLIGMEIFRPSDKKISFPGNDEDIALCEYRASVAVVIDRIKAMGGCIEDVKRGQSLYIDNLSSSYSSIDNEPDSKGLKIIKSFNFVKWQNTIKKLLEDESGTLGVKNTFTPQFEINNDYDVIFNNYIDHSFFGIGNETNYLSVILAILDLVNDKKNTYVALDYSDLVDGGFFSSEDDLCNDNLLEKTVILTEGSSDIRFIKRSLKTLYPHLYDYYSFLNFRDFRLPGSANQLVHTVKAFSAAGIKNKIIAIFDNDTAALSSLRNLKNIPIGKNIRVVTLPELEFLDNYPTIGPQGTKLMNVNSLAGSIEMYFEESSLKDKDGNLIPIAWKGYDEKEKKYQGEILQKKLVQNQFSEILDNLENGTSLSGYNFDSMRKVLELIFGFKANHCY